MSGVKVGVNVGGGVKVGDQDQGQGRGQGWVKVLGSRSGEGQCQGSREGSLSGV